MNIDRTYLITSIICNGHTETIHMIVRNPLYITRKLASDFMASCCYVEIAKMTQFTMQEDGTIIKVQ